MALEVIPVRIKVEIVEGDDLAGMLARSGVDIRDGDVVVVSQKAVSKQEGRIVELNSVIPSILAAGIASEYGKDPRLVEMILAESKRIVRMEGGIIICETDCGMVCANAGVDQSNVEDGCAVLLPTNPDASAKRLRQDIQDRTGRRVAVVISDTFGRPFRMGQTDCAIGVSGIEPVLDYTGKADSFGRPMRVTSIAVADELCGAAELVRGKVTGAPIAIIRNLDSSDGEGSTDLLRPEAQDLFR